MEKSALEEQTHSINQRVNNIKHYTEENRLQEIKALYSTLEKRKQNNEEYDVNESENEGDPDGEAGQEGGRD